MIMLYKALGALVTYPTPELIDALPEIEAIVRDARKLSKKSRQALAQLIAYLATGDLIDLQERYVEMFDRGRRTALHLFEHVHGDSRDRGQAMVDLKAIYARAGYVLATHELPDYLPAVLEFVSLQPEAAREILTDCAHIVRAIGEALQARGSPYSVALAAVLDAIGERGLADLPAGASRVTDEKPLDEEWQEAQVEFGPSSACSTPGQARQVSVVQFMPRPA
jgi:nitrate reductase delta subunit